METAIVCVTILLVVAAICGTILAGIYINNRRWD